MVNYNYYNFVYPVYSIFKVENEVVCDIWKYLASKYGLNKKNFVI